MAERPDVALDLNPSHFLFFAAYYKTCYTKMHTNYIMASPLTLRLDEKTRQRIARLARHKRLSTSEVIRQAIAAWADLHEPVTAPYEAMTDLLGVVRGGNPKRSEQTGRRLGALLKRRLNKRSSSRQ